MKILMAASELAPFAQTGQMADDVLCLARELQTQGHEVNVVLPLYRVIRENKSLKIRKTKTKFSVLVGPAKLACEVFEATTPDGLPVTLVSRDEFFDRTGLYGADGRDYQDNSARFVFFTKCAVELARRQSPDVFHAHSWQTALAPAFVRDQRLPLITVLSPHSLEFQGNFWSYDFPLTNLPGEYFSARGLEFYGSMNCLKGGILFSDAVVLPGRRFAAEMQTPDYGCGLESVLREQNYKLEGIPDGCDTSAWAGPASKGEKAKAVEALAKRCGLSTGGSLLLVDSTATNGKGLDLLCDALDRLPVDDARILFLGEADQAARYALGVARRRHAGRFAQIPTPDDALRAEALKAASYLLLPGPVEPAGSLVRRALKAGVIPIAAHCSGLREFVVDYDPVTNLGNGYVFYSLTPAGLADVIGRALAASPAERAAILAAAGASDFSWPASAKRHTALYERLLAKAGRSVAA